MSSSLPSRQQGARQQSAAACKATQSYHPISRGRRWIISLRKPSSPPCLGTTTSTHLHRQNHVDRGTDLRKRPIAVDFRPADLQSLQSLFGPGCISWHYHGFFGDIQSLAGMIWIPSQLKCTNEATTSRRGCRSIRGNVWPTSTTFTSLPFAL